MSWRVRHPAYNEYVTNSRKAAIAYVDTICDYLARREDVEIVEIDENGEVIPMNLKPVAALLPGDEYRRRDSDDWHKITVVTRGLITTEIQRADGTWDGLFSDAKVEYR